MKLIYFSVLVLCFNQNIFGYRLNLADSTDLNAQHLEDVAENIGENLRRDRTDWVNICI